MVQWIPLIVTSVGVLIVIAITILGWVVVPNIIENQIEEEVQLKNGTDTWDKWSEIPIPIYLNFYTFDVTNPDEVEDGKYPIFKEKGPYAYREQRLKVDVEFLPGSEEILRYRQVITYWYDQKMSCDDCSEDDRVNIINVPYLSVVSVLREELGASLAAFVANSILGSETLIRRNVKVGELTFAGFDVRLYTDTLGPFLPEEFEGGKFGLYRLNNGTDDGLYEIHTGVGNSAHFGEVLTYNGKKSVDDWWGDTYCAAINGTDGSLFPPFVEKSWTMYIFTTDLCRTVFLEFTEEIERLGIKGYRFVAPEAMLAAPSHNPDNACFCLEDDPMSPRCGEGGIINIKSCKGGAPIVMSTPHFYEGAEEYIEMFGMKPNKEKHETVIDVEPHSGLNLAANKRIQVNLEIEPIPEIPALAKIPRFMIFPLLWADEEARLDDETADDLKGRLLTPLKIVGIVKWVVLGLGLVLVGVGIAIYLVRRRRSVETV